MLNFIDFFKSITSTPALPSITASKAAISTQIISTVQKVEPTYTASVKFGKEITEMVHSDKFLKQLSDKIGQPRADESEDDFVARAKMKMEKLLNKFLINVV